MRRTAVVLLATTGLCCTAGPALAAPGDPETGYWAKTRTGLPVPVEPPDPVPEGGTWVSSDPTGPVAVSALRADLAPGLVAVQLRLTVADEIGTPAVQACPTTERWPAEQGGRLEAAPAADCSTPLEAVREDDVLVVPLPPGLGVVDVLLRPAPGSTFSLTLERATAASVVTQPEPEPFTPPPPPLDLGPPGSFASGPAFTSGGAPFLPPTTGSVDAPLLATPELPAPAPAAPAPAPQAAPAPVVPVFTAPRAALAEPEDRAAAMLAVAVLVLLGVQAARLAAQPAAPPRALGGAARLSPPESAPVVVVPGRGVGRFRRPDQVLVAQPPTRGVGRFRAERAAPPVRI